MRRGDREITDRREMESVLTANTVCTLGMVDGTEPYLLPMNYGYAEGCIYLHSALEGEKLAVIRKNPSVSIAVVDSLEPIAAGQACGHSMYYRSVICRGNAEILTGQADKADAMQILMCTQTGKEGWDIPDSALDTVAVLRVSVDRMTGKKKQPSPGSRPRAAVSGQQGEGKVRSTGNGEN
jgi:uncharacterized protein